jgi:hypothetical protein
MRGEWLLVVGEIDLDATPWLVNQPRAYSGVVVRCCWRWRCRLVCWSVVCCLSRLWEDAWWFSLMHDGWPACDRNSIYCFVQMYGYLVCGWVIENWVGLR